MTEIVQDKQRLKNIATTILAQIGHRNIICFGVPMNSLVFLPETEQRLGGVGFKFTNCPKVRHGTVKVELMPNDTYKVTIYNVRGREIYTADDIYCDGLFDVLNGVIG